MRYTVLALLLAGCAPNVTFQTRSIRNGTECTGWRANDRLHSSVAWVTCTSTDGEHFEPYPTEESSIFATLLGLLGNLVP